MQNHYALVVIKREVARVMGKSVDIIPTMVCINRSVSCLARFTKKNVDLFKVGTPRSVLLGEFGLPAASEMRNGEEVRNFQVRSVLQPGSKSWQDASSWHGGCGDVRAVRGCRYARGSNL